MSKHQRNPISRHRSYPSFSHRHFNLGNTIAGLQLRDKIPQGLNQSRYLRHQHLAVIHVGNETAVLLTETHQRATFLFDHSHCQPGLASIVKTLCLQIGQ